MQEEYQIEYYEQDSGKSPYTEWENSLSVRDRAIVTTRLGRVRNGNFGDCTPIVGAKGIFRLSIDFGPGYRIYFAYQDKKIILLLCGGIKKTQTRDIEKAKIYWKDYLSSA